MSEWFRFTMHRDGDRTIVIRASDITAVRDENHNTNDRVKVYVRGGAWFLIRGDYHAISKKIALQAVDLS